MSCTTTILPAQWNIAIVHGDRISLLEFTATAYDEQELTEYEPVWVFAKDAKSAPLYTLTDGSGLSKTGAYTRVDLQQNLLPGTYRHWLQIKVNGGQWVFTVAAGNFYVYRPGEMTGFLTGLERRTFTLPLRMEASGGLTLLDSEGNPVLDANGNFITTNQ